MIRRTFLALAPVAVLALAGCNNPSSSGSSPSGSASTTAAKTDGKSLMLNGAGATFPFPLYSKWVSDYQAAAPSVRVNYQSVGSGAGIRQISEKTVDFGASDAPMTIGIPSRRRLRGRLTRASGHPAGPGAAPDPGPWP